MKPGLCPDMPFMVNDWLSSTAVSMMTLAEQGAYVRLLCHAWNSPDCSLPNNDDALAALSSLGPDWAKGSGAKIKACFEMEPSKNQGQNNAGRNAAASIPDNSRIYSAKQRGIRNDQITRIEKGRQQRIDANNARWQKKTGNQGQNNAGRNAAASIPDCGRNADRTPPLTSHVSQIREGGTHNTREREESIPVVNQFKTPTIEQVKMIAAQSGLPEIEAELFFQTYEANGWMMGQNPMMNLSAAVGKWKTNWQIKSQEKRNGNQHPAANQFNNLPHFETGVIIAPPKRS